MTWVRPDPKAVVEAAERARAAFDAPDALLVDPPVLQPADLYVDLAGEDVRARLFRVEGPLGEALVMRPDFTIPIARHHLAAASAHDAPAAYRYEGKVFRFPPPDVDRPEEFIQIGLERYGASDPDAEDLAMLSRTLTACAQTGAVVSRIVLGDAGLFPAFLNGLGLPDAAIRPLMRAFAAGRPLSSVIEQGDGDTALASALADRPADDAARVLDEVYAMAGVTAVGGRPTSAVAERLIERAVVQEALRANAPGVAFAQRLVGIEAAPDEALAQVDALARESGCDLSAALKAWRARVAAIEALSPPAPVRVSIGFARQFSYYDGLVFELHDDALGAGRVLAAGGRYDTLAERLGAPGPASAVGAMVRPGRLAVSAREARP